MVVVVVLAGVAVLAAVVIVAMGRGGELAGVHPDHPPLPWGPDDPVTGTDAALLQLPRGLWGYEAGITDEALHRLAYELTERDTRIAVLEQQAAELRRRLGEVEDPVDPVDPPRAAALTPWATQTAAPPDRQPYEEGDSRWAPQAGDPPDQPAGDDGGENRWAPRAAKRDS